MTKQYHEIKPQSMIINPEFNLTATDIQHRSKSYVDEKTLRLAGIRRISADEGYQIMGYTWRKKDFNLSGLAIPFFDINDPPKVLEFNIRRDFPDEKILPNGERKEERKYIKPSRPNILYVYPQTRPEWLPDKTIPKIVTEGEFTAAALFRALSDNFTNENLRYVPLAITGVENWKATRNITTAHGEKVQVKDAVLELENMGIEGQTFILLFDSDKDENPQVNGAFWRLTRFLRGRKAKVLHAECPQAFGETKTKGIDDYLGAVEAAGGDPIKELLSILKSAEKPKKPPATIVPERFVLREFGEAKPGVFYLEETGEETFICPPLKVLSLTEDADGDKCGRLLEWKDDGGRVKRWAMPIEFVYADGAELVKHLASRGLNISPMRKNRERIASYIQSVKPSETLVSTDRIGWQNDCFVLPDETIGEAEKKIVYQTEFEGHHNFKTSGTLSDWQENISRYCSGNPLLMVAVSTAFASPLLSITGEKGGGLHYRGLTSLGKTTVLLCGGSVWGGDAEHGFLQTWKATANGLEIIAASHNHSLLCLDEIGECEPREVGNVAYMLANGRGKARMTKTIQAKKSLSWNLLFLSTGEKSLADIIGETGGYMKGGQDVRLCDIEADSGKYGIFEKLHGFSGGAELSYHLRSASCQSYGTASREFLRFLTETDFDDIRQNWQGVKTAFAKDCLEEINEEGFAAEVGRVADRFALIALGGELATEAQVTGWQKGEAYNAAKSVFLKWLKGRDGNGGSDAEKAFRQVVAFFEANPARFQNVEFPEDKPINRAGYFIRDEQMDETKFYVFPEAFRREIAKGFNYKFVAKTLFERGVMEAASSKVVHIKNIGTQRVYVMTDILAEKELEKTANV